MKKIISLLAIILLSACTTTSKIDSPQQKTVGTKSNGVKSIGKSNGKSAESSMPAEEFEPEEVVDIQELQSTLKLNVPNHKFGYFEKKFNTCNVGAGFSSKLNCRNKTLALINFRLMCRDSEGTTSEVVTDANLRPIANQSIKWNLKNTGDEISTDSDGFGQIVMVAHATQRTERLRLTAKNDFLVIRANEARSLVTPQNWCN